MLTLCKIIILLSVLFIGLSVFMTVISAAGPVVVFILSLLAFVIWLGSKDKP